MTALSALVACASVGDPVYHPGTTRKILQITGETDTPLRRPTLSQTRTRFGLNSTDLGSSVRTFQTFKWIAIAAVIYCLWTVLGGDPSTVVNAMVALLVSVPLYPFFIRSMEAAASRKRVEGGLTRP